MVSLRTKSCSKVHPTPLPNAGGNMNPCPKMTGLALLPVAQLEATRKQ
jgi:hypothetical protein